MGCLGSNAVISQSSWWWWRRCALPLQWWVECFVFFAFLVDDFPELMGWSMDVRPGWRSCRIIWQWSRAASRQTSSDNRTNDLVGIDVCFTFKPWTEVERLCTGVSDNNGVRLWWCGRSHSCTIGTRSALFRNKGVDIVVLFFIVNVTSFPLFFDNGCLRRGVLPVVATFLPIVPYLRQSPVICNPKKIPSWRVPIFNVRNLLQRMQGIIVLSLPCHRPRCARGSQWDTSCSVSRREHMQSCCPFKMTKYSSFVAKKEQTQLRHHHHHDHITCYDCPVTDAGNTSTPIKFVTSLYSHASVSAASISNIMHGTWAWELSKGIWRFFIVVFINIIFWRHIRWKLVEYQEVDQGTSRRRRKGASKGNKLKQIDLVLVLVVTVLMREFFNLPPFSKCIFSSD